MTTLALTLALLSAALFVWSYLIYPPLIARKAAATPIPGSGPAPPLSVEVVIAAADEEEVIADRVRDLLAQQAPGSLRVTVGCDGCHDETAARARAAGDGRVAVMEFRERRGKAAVLNDLVFASRADVVVFTDANTRFAPDAVARLVAPFAAPGVGAVCGRLRLQARAGEPAAPEVHFWDRETELKKAEGRLGICLGANGAIYAARRDLVEPLPPGSSMDDFLIPARIARRGFVVTFAGDAVAVEVAAGQVSEELSRRFRIGVGAGRVLREEIWLFDFLRRPRLAFVFVSRKAARWLAPLLLLLASLAALGSRSLSLAGVILLAAALAALAAAHLRPRISGAVGRLYYFGVMNLALAAGVAAGLLGMSRAAWRRTSR